MFFLRLCPLNIYSPIKFTKLLIKKLYFLIDVVFLIFNLFLSHFIKLGNNILSEKMVTVVKVVSRKSAS